MRFPDRNPVLDKTRAPKKFYPVLGLGLGERLLWHFPDSSSVLDKFQSATNSVRFAVMSLLFFQTFRFCFVKSRDLIRAMRFASGSDSNRAHRDI